MKKLVFTFGRMNPPTVGHQKLVDKVNSVARSNKADARVYLSHSQNNKKDPLDYDTKINLAKKAFGSTVTKSRARTIIEVLKELQAQKYTDIILVVGSDRIKEFKTLLDKYNGKDYTFNSIKYQSAGQRDPDAEGVSGMSASKMRAAAMEGDFTAFKSGLPKPLQSSAKSIYDMLRNIMEQEELDEAVMTLQQRMKRARMMKRLAKKYARKRSIRKKRFADASRLLQRARKAAKNILRKKVAGKRGEQYKQLSYSGKMSVDKLVDKRTAVIDKLAKRLLPKIRKAEIARVASARKTTTEEFDWENDDLIFELFESDAEEFMTELFEAKQDSDIKDREGTQPAKYHSGLKKSTKISRDQAFKRGAEKDPSDPSAYPDSHPGDKGAKTKMSKHTKKYHQMFGDKKEQYELEESAKEALMKKAKKSGISYSILKKVYDRGMAAWRTGHRPGAGQEQWAFARVNSFITKGKGTWGKADADLARQVRGESIEEQRVDEISKDAANRYMWSAMSDRRERDKKISDAQKKQDKKFSKRRFKNISKMYDKNDKRTAGIGRALNKLSKEDCWDGYTQQGMKKKGDRVVPNCVKEEKIPHALDPKKSLKHAMTDIGLDVDVDGDVDILDKMAKRVSPQSPDEVTGTEKNTKQVQAYLKKRGELEKKHTKIGVAYEAVSPAQQAAIAIAKKESGDYDKEGKRKKSYKEMMNKATNREEGSDSLRKIYSDMTPGQTVKEAIEYHKINSLCLKENIFRPHTEQYYKFFCEARRLWEAGELQVDDPFDVMLLKSDAGLLGMYEGMEVPLDIPMIEEEKDPPLNKPKAGGPKKYYVFVKDPSTGNIKKVTWGDTTGLKIKLNDPAARKSFAARHKCSTKTDKTKPGYWACRMPYYAKELGLSGGGSFFW